MYDEIKVNTTRSDFAICTASLFLISGNEHFFNHVCLLNDLQFFPTFCNPAI